MPRVLITGTSSGLGLEFVRQYAVDGWEVIATCRTPDRAADLQALAAAMPTVRVARLDVTSGDDVRALATDLDALPIDLLINNAGIMGPPLACQSLGRLDYSAASGVFDVNCLGALRVAEAFRPHVAASEGKRVVCVSSGNGSVALTAGEERSGLYIYRASKAALNVVMAAYSRDVAMQGITVLLLSPGLVDSNFADGSGADLSSVPLITPADSVAAMRPLIAEALPTSVAWRRYTGDVVPW